MALEAGFGGEMMGGSVGSEEVEGEVGAVEGAGEEVEVPPLPEGVLVGEVVEEAPEVPVPWVLFSSTVPLPTGF